MSSMDRRTFLEFLGKSTVGMIFIPPLLSSCTSDEWKTIVPIAPASVDRIVLADGFFYDLLIKWGDPISATDQFGFNNDFNAFIPFDPAKPDDGFLWVNHEYIHSGFVSGYWGKGAKSREQVEKEMYAVGGSILHIRQKRNGAWEVVKNDPLNRRITGMTDIPFQWPTPIYGRTSAMGTLANCAGGVTPWGTFLTCEENYDSFYGERDFQTGGLKPGSDKWYEQFDNPPEHYGWVVEVDPRTGAARKHVALGRCAHESATVASLPDGRVVVYSGDDANDQCLYKFVGSEPNTLEKGTLYVADLEAGKWLPVDFAQQPLLQQHFADQTEVLIRLREAAHLLGGTPLDRPEDVEIDPHTGAVVVALTNNLAKRNFYGSILRIEEDGGDHAALHFRHDTLLTGGPETGFACPDNLAFDAGGNLWFTSDISGSYMHKAPYEDFKNNALYVLPRQGPQAGQILRVAVAPTDAEFSGPWFAPDGRTLFLSVQHPGENTGRPDELTSHWPDGGDSIPRPSVITIRGKALDELQMSFE
ncbi:MAG: DUF839 domain-containing protein [Lewinellaceae bacterium]|nr:DUF839 domain-containing protein [Lewinellaceae bacterium]